MFVVVLWCFVLLDEFVYFVACPCEAVCAFDAVAPPVCWFLVVVGECAAVFEGDDFVDDEAVWVWCFECVVDGLSAYGAWECLGFPSLALAFAVDVLVAGVVAHGVAALVGECVVVLLRLWSGHTPAVVAGVWACCREGACELNHPSGVLC